MLDRYIKPGHPVIDIGRGPGRYSLYLAKKGCHVTLFDLSAENTKFAGIEATRQGLTIQTITGDAREANILVKEQFNHVLLMGPMYHLLDETDRIKTVNAALKLLIPGGVIFISFVSMMGGIIYGMKDAPQILASDDPFEMSFTENFIAKKSTGGMAFTKAYFIEQSEILPFMTQFSLKKLHFFGQEGIMSPCEKNIMSQPKEIVDLWLDLCEKTCEREELLSWSEHLMYVGQKI
jgi:2-polyprenyl-3-methyl-5-hydroxy-6-metoxy-1,4-benzoquinol methylase